MAAFALNPEHNVRVYSTGFPASHAAAGRWMASGPMPVVAPLGILIENPPQCPGELLTWPEGYACAGDARLIRQGSEESIRHLFRLVERDARPLAYEMSAALTAFHDALLTPPRTLVMGILNVT